MAIISFGKIKSNNYKNELSPEKVYQMSQLLAEELSKEFEVLFPDFFKKLVSGVNLKSLFLYVFTFKLSRGELNSLLQQCDQIGLNHTPTLLINSLLNLEHLRQHYNINVKYRYEIYNNYRKKIEEKFDSIKCSLGTPQKNKALFLIGRNSDLNFLKSLKLSEQTLYILKKEFEFKSPPTMDPLILLTTGELFVDQESEFAQFRNYIKMCLNFSNFSTSKQKRRIQIIIYHFIEGILYSLKLKHIISSTQPTIVAGCLEKTPFGPILTEIKRTSPFLLVNFQHGIIPITYTTSYSNFDYFFCWNQLSKETLLKDQYPNKKSIKIVGRPPSNPDDIDEQLFQKMVEFKGNSKLILVIEQLEKEPFIRRQDRNLFFKYITKIPNEIPNTKIIIKRHPKSHKCVLSTKYQNIIELDGDTSLNTSVELCDLVLTMQSATFYDAIEKSKPTVFFIPNRSKNIQSFEVEKHMPVARTDRDIFYMTKKYLSKPEMYFNEHSLEKLIPTFSNAYEQRIQGELAKSAD